MSEETGSDVCRLRIEFENNEIDWEHPLDLNGRIIKAMYVNDERIRECYACSKRAELIAENNALLVKVVDLTEEREQWREAAGNAHEMWEQADNERIKLVEQLEACRSALEILTLDKAKLQTKIDKLTADVSQAVEDTAERVTNQGEMLDSREKLEADSQNKLDADLRGTLLLLVDDVAKTAHEQTFKKHLKVDAWWNAFVRITDRQAAITERHILTQPDERDEQIAELQAKVDELIAEIDALEYQCDLDELEGGGDD